jgi:hypothetical protein
MGKLSDMAVSRVDGVDKPAIRKRWVLVKNEDGAESVEKDYAGASKALVEALAKESGISFSDETVEVLRTLVELLDLDVEFAAKAEDGDEDEGDEGDGDGEGSAEGDESEESDGSEGDEGDEGEGDEGVEKTTYSADEVEAVVAKALAAAGVDVSKLTKSEKTSDVSALRVTKSRQPKGDVAESGARKKVKKGEGMFSNIVLGKATEPYRGR